MNLWEMGRILSSGVGAELVETIQRIARKQGLPTDQILRESLAFTKRMEDLGARSGKSVKEVADQALDLYEGRLR